MGSRSVEPPRLKLLSCYMKLVTMYDRFHQASHDRELLENERSPLS